MFDTDNVNYIELKLLTSQIDILLRSLELYAFNFNYIAPIDKNSSLEDLRSSLIYHTYNQLLSIRGEYNNINSSSIKQCRKNYIRNKHKLYYSHIHNRKINKT